MNKVLQMYDVLSAWRVKLPRIMDARKELRMKKEFFGMSPLGKDKKLLISKLWRRVGKVNHQYFSLYNSNNKIFDPRYIPDDLYYGTIDPYFNRALDCAAMDDKNLYDLYFPDAPQPLTIARKINGNYQDKEYRLIDEEEFIRKCENAGRVILKKSIYSDGGHGVAFWDVEMGDSKMRQLLSELGDNVIAQEIIKQHEQIAKLHPSSINSIRILTLNYHNEIRVLSSIIRMGANGNNVDNGHAGGIFVGIEPNGRLKSTAYTYMTGQRFWNEHPTTHAKFSDCTIPNFEQCKDLVKNLAPRFARVSRLTSWDLSVDVEGNPVLIEVNLAYGGLFFHQITNGPVFGDLTEDIINEVIKK